MKDGKWKRIAHCIKCGVVYGTNNPQQLYCSDYCKNRTFHVLEFRPHGTLIVQSKMNFE